VPVISAMVAVCLTATACAAPTQSGSTPVAALPSESAASQLPRTSITVSAAASLTDVFPAIATSFAQRYPHITVTFNFAGSNALVEQLRAGAPVDVIATASEETMRVAVRGGWAAQPTVFAQNTMVIATPPGNPAGVSSIRDLELSRVLTAVCAPAVPCGQAADRLFARNNVTVTPVTEELDVRGVLGKVMADQVDAGIVYATDARAAGSMVTAIVIEAADNVITDYPIATVTYSANQSSAQAFVDFVLTASAARTTLRVAGFTTP
jgi:molybdate transport system substrate-binding protein